MVTPPAGGGRPFLFLLLAVVLALVISISAAYSVVVSQNPKAAAKAPTFVYGSPSP